MRLSVSTSGQARTITLLYANQSFSRSAAGMCWLVFLPQAESTDQACLVTDITDCILTTRFLTGLPRVVRRLRTSRCARLVRVRVGVSRLNVWAWKCGVSVKIIYILVRTADRTDACLLLLYAEERKNCCECCNRSDCNLLDSVLRCYILPLEGRTPLAIEVCWRGDIIWYKL